MKRMTTKDRLHALIDALPDRSLSEAERLLVSLAADPLIEAFLAASEDDEPLTEEDIEALDEARAARERGELIPWEEVKARLLGAE